MIRDRGIARYVFGWEYRSGNVSNQVNSDIWSWNYMRYDTTFAVDNEIRYYDVTPRYCIMRGIWMAKESVCSIMSEARLTLSTLGVEVSPFTQALSTSISAHVYICLVTTELRWEYLSPHSVHPIVNRQMLTGRLLKSQIIAHIQNVPKNWEI